MQNSVSLALYTNNATILQDAYSRAMSVMTVSPRVISSWTAGAYLSQFADTPMQDGIHRDGAFLQHKGVLYNGNYGKDLVSCNLSMAQRDP